MTRYEQMIQTDRNLIMTGTVSPAETEKIVTSWLAAADREACDRFFAGISRIAPQSRAMYPIFYAPSWNDGKKCKTILEQTPKTWLFSANYEELETVRMLNRLAPDHPQVRKMTDAVSERLSGTCFGAQDDGVGECFDASLVVLRYAGGLGDSTLIRSRVENYLRHRDEKKRPWFSEWYFRLCLSELPETDFLYYLPEAEKRRADSENWLFHKGCVMNSEQDRRLHPLLICILRNLLVRLPDSAVTPDQVPAVNPKDNRLYLV